MGTQRADMAHGMAPTRINGPRPGKCPGPPMYTVGNPGTGNGPHPATPRERIMEMLKLTINTTDGQITVTVACSTKDANKLYPLRLRSTKPSMSDFLPELIGVESCLT